MRNLNWTRLLTILLALLALYALFAVLAGLIQRFIVPLLLVLLAAILAFVLTPVVAFLHSRLHLMRWLSIVMTYLLVAGILITLGYFMTTPLIAQTKSLADAIKNPTHIENVVRVKTTTETIATQASRLNYNVGLYSRQAGPVSSPTLINCSTTSFCYSWCYLGYYLGARNTALTQQAGCRRFWRDRGPHWRQFFGVPLPSLNQKLEAEIGQLSKSRVRSTSDKNVKGQTREAQIPTAQIPPSYYKTLVDNLTRFRSNVARARSDFIAQAGTPIFIADVKRLQREAAAVGSNGKSLYTLVHSTPILILALQNAIDVHHLPIDVHKALGSAVGKLRSQGTTILDNAVTILTGTVNVVFDLIIIIIMSLYMLADGPRFIGWAMGIIPEKNREQAWFFVDSLSRVLGGYVRGQLIVAITIGLLAGIGCYAIGVPYALLLGIFAFLAESVPVMGPVLASIPAIIVSAFTVSILRTAIVIGWFVVIQQIEQNVVGPRITGRAVGIHPVAAMIAVIIGLEIGGIWGAFLAVPVTGVLFVLASESYNYFVLRRPLPTAEIPQSVEVEEMEVGVGDRTL